MLLSVHSWVRFCASDGGAVHVWLNKYVFTRPAPGDCLEAFQFLQLDVFASPERGALGSLKQAKVKYLSEFYIAFFGVDFFARNWSFGGARIF